MATAQTSIDDLESHEADALSHLEERIQKTVALVSRLRDERGKASEELVAAQTALSAANAELADSRDAQSQLSAELAALRAEKLQVRNRLEKLLGHIDQLGTV